MSKKITFKQTEKDRKQEERAQIRENRKKILTDSSVPFQSV